MILKHVRSVHNKWFDLSARCIVLKDARSVYHISALMEVHGGLADVHP